MFSDEVRVQVNNELAAAETARAGGNEGKARVCARRAAGAAAREYLRLSGQETAGSGYEMLGILAGLAGVPRRAVEAAQFLRLKVDANYQLPVQIDLLHEARVLAQELERLV